MRNLTRLSLDTLRFIQHWMDAYDAGMGLEDFCEMFEVCRNTAYGYRHRLRKRGIDLPYLDGMKIQRRRECKSVDNPRDCECEATAAATFPAAHTFQVYAA